MLSKIFIFVTGAAIGSVATWKLVKTRYEQIANEEIESVREFYKNKDAEKEEAKNYIGDPDPTIEDVEKEETEKAMTDYRSYASAYMSEEKEEEEEDEEEDDMEDRPYVISPEEFGEAGYEQISFTLYADGILADEQGYEMTDEEIEESVGKDALNHFGEFEDDSVFVRNDKLELDYEILKDLRKYNEV